MLLGAGRLYSIDYVVNGKKDDPIVIKELYVNQLPGTIKDSITHAKDGQYILKATGTAKDTVLKLENNIVKVTTGKLATDGILPTSKNTIFDIILPLIAYLAFFCGILQLLIDSGASERLARMMSPVFVKVFPEVPANHPSISYMMLNFAANFLGLDSAATPLWAQGYAKPAGTEPRQGQGQQFADHVYVPACGRAYADTDVYHRLPGGAECGQPGGCDAAMYHHLFCRHIGGTDTGRHQTADQF